MSKSGAVLLGEFPLAAVEGAYDRCERYGRYSKAGPVAKYGAAVPLPELASRLSANCAKRANLGARSCGAFFPALANKGRSESA
jgi:hypothetical protein